MSYLKSASSNLLTCKVSFKNRKILNLGPKIPYLNVENYYKIFHQHPQICENIKYSWDQKGSIWVFGLEC